MLKSGRKRKASASPEPSSDSALKSSRSRIAKRGKIEPPGSGDPGRNLMPGMWEDSEYFVNWNSNKRSVVIDLRQPQGRELLLKMVPRYDVFVENYGPGVIEKLDLGYERLKAVHPQLIYARVKGFGTSGPYAKYKCFDMVAQATGGAMAMTGTVCDAITSTSNAIAMCRSAMPMVRQPVIY